MVIKTGLNLLFVYLTYSKQRIKVNSLYITWSDIIRGVPQGSVLVSLLFSFFINDLLLFIEKSEIYNFTDVNTLFRCGHNISDSMSKLKRDMEFVFKMVQN